MTRIGPPLTIEIIHDKRLTLNAHRRWLVEDDDSDFQPRRWESSAVHLDTTVLPITTKVYL